MIKKNVLIKCLKYHTSPAFAVIRLRSSPLKHFEHLISLAIEFLVAEVNHEVVAKSSSVAALELAMVDFIETLRQRRMSRGAER